jgi:16S rRNA (cytosine1402-N4)-methyltransferase
MSNYHLPVLPEETLEYLKPSSMNLIVDGTLGDGGHAELILKNTPSHCRLLGIDRDPSALERAKKRLAPYKDRIILVHGNYKDITEILMEERIDKIDGFLLDLGVSSQQLDTPERGFSLKADGPLDMRMNPSDPKTAADLLGESSDKELYSILREYGEERFSKRIVRAIRKAQANNPLKTTLQLARIVRNAAPQAHHFRIDPATRTFQGLRIAVNNELEPLKQTLKDFLFALNKTGRAIVISFHSLEDRIVKHVFAEKAKGCICPPKIPMCICGIKSSLQILTKKPVRASSLELEKNSRASSAKLRAAVKIYA